MVEAQIRDATLDDYPEEGKIMRVRQVYNRTLELDRPELQTQLYHLWNQ